MWEKVNFYCQQEQLLLKATITTLANSSSALQMFVSQNLKADSFEDFEQMYIWLLN